MTPSIAKFRLYNKSPFWGSILFNLPIVETETVGPMPLPTLGVDGETLYVNPRYWASLTDKQQLAALCHEVGHLFLGHVWRRGHRTEVVVDPKSGQMVSLFNLAGDVVINNLILEDTNYAFDVPRDWFVRRDLAGKYTEEVYEILKKEIPKMTQEQMQQMVGGMCSDKDGYGKKKSKAQAKEDEAKWMNIGKQAVETAKRQGKLPAGVERLFKELEPKEDWRQVLLSYVQPFWNDYSFNPTDRRFLEEEFALPDIQVGEKIDWLAIAIDTSGSIGPQELNSFISEVKSILGSFDKVRVKLTFCDAYASPFIELDEFDPAKIKVTGGGGTDFNPVFDMIKKEPNEPLALVYFTDGFGDFPLKAPFYDTIWISTSADQVTYPFGKILPYDVS